MSKAKVSHPSAEQLEHYARGQLPAPVNSEVERHLLDCDTCCRQIATLPEDSLVALAKAGKKLPLPHPPGPNSPAATADRTAVFLDHPRYRILEPLGEGGMGAVYKAEHRRMERVVALKVIQPRLVQGDNAVERFHREVKAAAKLNHPNIVAAYDADQVGDTHFLVMEYVNGLPLSDYLKKKGPLPVHHACEFVRQAALGLQHAHDKGMVHRDIKPANLMLTPRGQVKILDFGLARLSSAAAQGGDGGLTQEGSVMGTPDYIAPEQATDARKADIRADIYSLGCTLYCLLTGRPPFPDGTHIEKILAHIERRPTPLEEFRTDAPVELARVVEKMMAKDPAERYQTPVEVVKALEPFCRAPREPAEKTRPATPWFRRPRMLIAAAAAAAALVLLGVLIFRVQTPQGVVVVETDDPDVEVIVKQGGQVITIIDKKTGHQATLKDGEYELELGPAAKGLKLKTDRFTLTRDNRKEIVKVWRGEADGAKLPPGGGSKSLSIVADWKFAQDADGKPVKDGQLVGAHNTSANLKDDSGNAFKGTVWINSGKGPVYASYLITEDKPDLDGFALRTGLNYGNVVFTEARDDLRTNMDFSVWMRVMILARVPSERHFLMTRPGRWDVFVWEDGTLDFWFGSWNNALRFPWREKTELKNARPFLYPYVGRWVDLGFSFQGKATNKEPDRIKVYIDGRVAADFVGPANFDLGEQVHLGSGSSGAAPCDALYDRVIFYDGVLDDQGFRKLSATKDGKLPPAPETVGEVRRLEGHTNLVRSLSLTSDGKRALTTSHDLTVIYWDLEAGKEIYRFGQGWGANKCRILPDDQTAVLSLENGEFVLWNLEKRAEQNRFSGPKDWPLALAVTPDGKKMITGGYGFLKDAEDKTIRVWDLASGKVVQSFKEHQASVWDIAVSKSGQLALSASKDGTVRLWEIDSGREVQVLKSPLAWNYCCALSPDDQLAASSGPDRIIRLWDLKTGKVIRRLVGHARGGVTSLRFSTDGSRLLSGGGHDGTARLWDVKCGREIAQFPGNDNEVYHAEFTADERHAVTGGGVGGGGNDHALRVWKLPDPAKPFTPPPEPVGLMRVIPVGADVQGVAISPDGERAWTANGFRRTVTQWDLTTGRRVTDTAMPGGGGQVFSVAVSDDGSRALAGGPDGTVRLWDVAGGKTIHLLKGHEQAVTSVRFSIDASKAASGSFDKTVRVWNLETGDQMIALAHPQAVEGIAWADGEHVLTACHDGMLRLWHWPSGKEVQKIPGGASRNVAVVRARQWSLSADDKGVLLLWDLKKGKEVQRLTGHQANVVSLAVSADGKRVLSGDVAGIVRLWDLEAGTELEVFRGHQKPVMGVGFTPDGRFGLSGSEDGTLRLWRLPE